LDKRWKEAFDTSYQRVNWHKTSLILWTTKVGPPTLYGHLHLSYLLYTISWLGHSNLEPKLMRQRTDCGIWRGFNLLDGTRESLAKGCTMHLQGKTF
jgi:hypothetical protein